MMTVTGPSGVTVTFPDGTPPEVIDRVMRERFGQQAAPPQTPLPGLPDVSYDPAALGTPPATPTLPPSTGINQQIFTGGRQFFQEGLTGILEGVGAMLPGASARDPNIPPPTGKYLLIETS